MLIKWELAAARRMQWNEYATRFLFGGTVTTLAGLIASHYGPAVGGLFLAFPAIFPAAASLVDTHERKKRSRLGQDGTGRGRVSAAVDAAGTAVGCIGLLVFAIVTWQLLQRTGTPEAIAIATVCWAAAAACSWFVWKRGRRWLQPITGKSHLN